MITSPSKSISASKVEVRTSGISGHGTFAKEHIKSGEYITTLSGVRIPAEQHEPSDDNPLQVREEEYLILEHASRVINHSCDPNAGLRNTSDLFAIRDISPGEEITYDYSTTVGTNDDWVMSRTCQCAAAKCRNSVGNILSLPAETLARYIHANTLPDFIKRQLKAIGKL